MALLNQLKEDMKTAMRGKDSATLDVLRLLISSLKNKTIELKREIEDEDVIAAVRSDVKKLEDAMKDFVTAAREDLIEKTNEELRILKSYLPPEMGADELEQKVRDIIGENGLEKPADTGRAMGVVMGAFKGQVDGNRVREMVEKVLKGDDEA